MYKFIKRLLDFFVALVAVFLCIPFILIISIAIKLDSKGPIFFKQERTGYKGKNFMLYKFRSMSLDNDVHNFKEKNKLTKVGKFIRKTSLDEIPQLFNILRGEMSFVGPRPWITDYAKYFTKKQVRRLDVLPGITGLAQASGRNAITVLDKINYDIEYVNNLSFFMDIKVIFLTVREVFKKDEVDITKEGIKDELTTLKENYKKIKESKEKELVSIVVPVYNAEKFLEETINTVLNQTYDNYELLLVNDCSKDNSKSIAEKYLSDKIKWIDMKKNSGAALTRNKGIEVSNGRYVCFLDADDLWEKEKLEKQIKFMNEHDCEFSFTGYEFADSKGIPNGKKVYIPENINYKRALKNTTIWTSTVMLDMKKLSKEDIYMPNVRRGQDTATWWKILKKIDYAYGLNEILSYYRRTDESLSANKITALKRTWNLYRNVEKLNIFSSFYNFCWYCFNAVRRRI